VAAEKPLNGNIDALNESAALQLLAQGNELAFVQLYDQYNYTLYMTALKMLKSSVQAEEVTQEVFLRVWTRRETMAGVENFKAYLFTMMRNLVYTKYRETQLMTDAMREYAQDLKPENSTARVMEQEELDRLVAGFIEELPATQKTIFRLSKQEHLTHEAIASQLNLTTISVKSHMKRALASLRTKLKPHLGTGATLLSFFQLIQTIF
jgi:RNA polymerase sigma-70 factor (family 1)